MTTDRITSATRISHLVNTSRGWLAATCMLLVAAYASTAEAKVPGKTYCYNGICHYVKTIAETQRSVGRTDVLRTSFYDDPKRDRFNPSNLTSSGEYFRAWKPDNAASPIYPNGTKLLVWNKSTGKAVVVRVNNSGPYHSNRTLDVSVAAADALGFRKSGVAYLHTKVLSAPSKSEATYSKGRSYDWVAGDIGKHASLDAAFARSGFGGGSVTLRANASPKQKSLR